MSGDAGSPDSDDRARRARWLDAALAAGQAPDQALATAKRMQDFVLTGSAVPLLAAPRVAPAETSPRKTRKAARTAKAKANGSARRTKRSWTAEDLEILRARYKAGDSGSAIAAALGRSASSVFTKAHAMGLAGHGRRKKAASLPARAAALGAPTRTCRVCGKNFFSKRATVTCDSCLAGETA